MGEKSHYGKRLWGEDVRVWKMEIMELCLAFSELFSMWSIGVEIGFLPTGFHVWKNMFRHENPYNLSQLSH